MIVDKSVICSHALRPSNASAESLLMFFAPKFDNLGCEVARALVANLGSAHVHGLCTGPGIRDRIAAELGEFGGRFWQLESEEERWLSTPASASNLERLEQELGPGAFGRIVTADRRVGRGFVRGALMAPNRISRLVARKPSSAAQQYVSGLYLFLDDVLRETAPDVVFCYAIAGAPAVALAELCVARRVRFCRFISTRIGDRYIVDDDHIGRQACISRRFERAREGNELFTPRVVEEARLWLKNFRESPIQPGYSRNTQSPNLFRELLLFPLRCLREFTRGRRPQAARLLFEMWVALRCILPERMLMSSLDALPTSFIYFPLHVNPEASTMVLSPWHTDQLAVIEALAKAAPANMKIVVKEHSPMLGRRPPEFYRQIARMPRVILLAPGHSSFSLIRKAALTAVITGTAAWEALLLGKPTLVIGDSPFLAIRDGLVHEPDLSRLPDAICAALALPPASDDVLNLYLSAVFEESLEMPQSLLWGKYESHSRKEQHSVCAAIASAIVELMGKKEINANDDV